MTARPIPVRIRAMGRHLPSRRVLNPELEAHLGLSPGWIERATGVRERRRVMGETSAQLAAGAIRDAAAHGSVSLADLDLIVGASTAPQQAIPCTAVFVQRELGLSETRCYCFDINATCLSFHAALVSAGEWVASGRSRLAAVVSSEITSFSVNESDKETAVLFGDAAAAVLLEPAEPGSPSAIHGARFWTDSTGAELAELPGGGTRYHANNPATRPEMNTFTMQGRSIFRRAVAEMGPFLEAFLRELGWARESIRLVVPHQASGRGVEQLWCRWGFQREQVQVNLPERGNCLAASTPLALAEAHADRPLERGDRVLLVGTGAGLSLAVIGLTY